MGRMGRSALLATERRWAHAVDAVLTVNAAYAEILGGSSTSRAHPSS